MDKFTQSKQQWRNNWMTVVLLTLVGLFQLTHLITLLQLPTEIAAVIRLPVMIQIIIAGLWIFLCGITMFLWRKPSENVVKLSNWLLLGFLIYTLARLIIFAQADYDIMRRSIWLIITFVLISLPIYVFIWLRIMARR